MKKEKYITPEVHEISIDKEISLQLSSLDELPPEFENERVYNINPGSINIDTNRLA